MEIFLEFLREVLKGIVREISAYFFRKNILENKKTTLRRRKQSKRKVSVKYCPYSYLSFRILERRWS